MARTTWTLSAVVAVVVAVGTAPAWAQQAAGGQRMPSPAQAEIAAEMNETGSPYVAPAPESHATPAEPSQTFGNGAALGGLNAPVAVDAGVEQPYSNSWAEDVGGQPGSQNHGAVLARLFGSGTQP